MEPKSLEEMNSEELREYTEMKLTEILSVLSDVALGDLTVEVPVTNEDIFGSVAMGVNVMVKGLRELKAQDEEKTLLLEKVNQELEDFVYIVSHDLKAPLRAIAGLGQFLEEDYSGKLGETGQNYVKRIVQAADRMQQLIDNLLELSRIGRHHNPFTEVDAAELVRRAVGFVHPGDDVKITIHEPMPRIVCDEVRLEQIFANLVTNAVKYNDREVKLIDIGWIGHPEEGYDEFTVRDNGIGIAEKHQEKIFKIFQRLHANNEYGGGSGVGLNIVKKIVQQHGGKIWVEPTPGEGSVFHFTISRGEPDTLNSTQESLTKGDGE